MSCYLLQETGGRFTLEDGSGFLLIENCVPAPTTTIGVVGSGRRRRRLDGDQIHRDDEEFLLIIASLE